MPETLTILACDTTQPACSAAVHLPDGTCHEIYCEIGRGHAELLPSMLCDVMAQAGVGFAALDRLAVTIGPGTFMGVRVGLSAMRALALVCGVPVQGITTFKAIAAAIAAAITLPASPADEPAPERVLERTPERARDDAPIAVVMAAPREQVYTQAFAADLTPLTEPQNQTAQDFITRLADQNLIAQHIRLVGSAAPLFAPLIPTAQLVEANPYPRAKIIATLAATQAYKADTDSPAPFYLRPPDANLPDPNQILKRI